MKFLGGKSRIAKQIGSFLNSEIERLRIERYIEPFSGACWITQEINPNINRIACDVHKDLILLFQELQNGWIPPDNITEEQYKELKYAESSALRGFVGFGCSFSGKWFGGYARCKTKPRNYCGEAKRTLLKKIEKLKDVKFKNISYLDIPIEKIENRAIYCDPPYFGVTSYSCGKFDSERFWSWCRQASQRNHLFISEYKAPSDFKVVLEIQTKTDMQTKAGKEMRTEKVFVYKK